ncbi:hypothetical protein [Dietzia sp. WMMA184]|uniref:hypothetical protein n=1 Tax=Dietzia sp. WMMA184 TaxID=2039808 RepID=UPI0020B16AB5|nr:hypothetical protein [Dietzia sp. WMMA184]
MSSEIAPALAGAVIPSLGLGALLLTSAAVSGISCVVLLRAPGAPRRSPAPAG